MGQEKEYKDQASLTLLVFGSGCTTKLESDLRTELSNSFRTHVRSWHGPAAGASVMAEAIIDFYTSMPDEVKQLLIAAIWEAIRSAISKFVKWDSTITSITIRDIDYDVKICSREGAGLELERSEMNILLNQIKHFVDSERKAGNEVGSVVLPCILSERNGVRECSFGDGSQDLWYVSYKEEINRGYSVCYDNANKCFVEDVVADDFNILRF